MPHSRKTVHSGCKINLYLYITGVRKNGYHNLDTVFLPLSEPYDKITFLQETAIQGCTLTCNQPELAGEKNIMVKAWEKFADRTGFAPNISVHIEKNVPTGAGLGGGSANAAAMLTFLNESAGEKSLAPQDLHDLAAQLGADIPFFFEKKACHATGIGEQLAPVALELNGFTLLLACPPVHVSTPWAFTVWDQENEKNTFSSLTSKWVIDIKPSSRALWLFNSFEQVVFSAFPELRAYKKLLLQYGASAAAMTGSGASLFALYREMEMAQNATAALAEAGVATYLCRL